MNSPRFARMRANILVAAIGLIQFAAARVLAQASPQPPRVALTDQVRLREAVRLAGQLGDRIWPAWNTAPFTMILIAPDYEYLLHEPRGSAGFATIGADSDTLLGGPVFYRKRIFAPGMQATFPAVNGVNTIVIGRAEQTLDSTSTRWVLTVLHEHFHQFVYSHPGYYADVAKLGLAHGDETGMWMLNYPFPYDSARVQEKFTAMTHALLDALAHTEDKAFKKKLDTFRRTQREFAASVPAEAERYFAFQLWQEGVARYTELRIGELAAKRYTPSTDFSALADFRPFGAVSTEIRTRIMNDLGSLSLAQWRRGVVYSVGAAEALLLDHVKPGWKDDYFRHPFRLPEP